MHLRFRTRRLGAVLPLVVAAAIGLAACTTSSNETTKVSTSSSDSALKDLYEGTFTAVPTAGPKAQTGKNIWYISCGQTFLACSSSGDALKSASKELGWKLTVFDGQSDPSKAANGIQSALAAGADGIAVVAYDCSGIKGALQQAKAAGVPVVASFSADCNEGGEGTALYSSTEKLAGTETFCDFQKLWGKNKARYLAATQPDAKVVDLHETSQFTQKCAHEGFVAELKNCADCEIVSDAPFTFANIAQLAQTVSSSLLKASDATAINVPADTLVPAAVAPAIQQQSKVGKVAVIGGEGFPANLELIAKGVQTAAIGYSYDWAGWGLADNLNRLLAGEKSEDLPNQGGGFLAIDADHNLPEDPAAGWTVPVDYRSAYTAIWSGK